jgi:hypothetical protein
LKAFAFPPSMHGNATKSVTAFEQVIRRSGLGNCRTQSQPRANHLRGDLSCQHGSPIGTGARACKEFALPATAKTRTSDSQDCFTRNFVPNGPDYITPGCEVKPKLAPRAGKQGCLKLGTRVRRTVPCMRLARLHPLLATKWVAWMTALRVVREISVLFLDTRLEPQLHKPNPLWQPGRLAGHSPDTRRTLAGHSP